MSKIAKALTAIQVSRLTQQGSYAVGTVAGLNLVVGPEGRSRSWVLRLTLGSKRREVGLGSYPEITMAAAHSKARELKEQARQGVDPLAERDAKKAIVEWTFDRCAAEFIKLHRPSWKNAKHAAQWESTLATYASPVMGSKHVRDITVGDVLTVVEPLWHDKNETMVRTLGRIELILGWAASREYRSKENPAQWRGNLQYALPKPSKVNNRQHHAALPYLKANDFMQKLALVEGMSAKALQWVMLTACRSGEARGAHWGEIDLEAALWTVPASRMKGGKEHRVPLSIEALELLQTLPRFEPPEGQPDYLFPGRSGGALSDMSLTLSMRRMKVDAVPHGMRSTFADWATEQTTYPVELREMALAHALGDKTQAAYQRGDMLDKRRQMMQDWARYLHTAPASAKVVSIKAA